MNADSTGVCQECGMEYDLDAIKAMVGQKAEPAAPVQAAPQPAAPVAAASDEIDRETLLAYIGDLRTMETIINESNNNFNILIEREKENRKKYNSIKDEINRNESEIKRLNSKNYNKVSYKALIPSLAMAIGGFVIALIAYSSNPIFAMFALIVCFIGVIIAVTGAANIRDSNNFIAGEEYKKKEALHFSNRKIDECNVELEKYNKTLGKETPQIRTLKADIEKEKADVEATLEKAYSANIIPQQFRNIEGVYYLYDYLSTSNQSLSEALMQANLEAIKQKMDSMIKLQSAQIVQQAQANAKLDRVINISEATMNNTAVAAKYAQIAAVNSELNVKLAAESLAYQKAAFWLK